MICHPADRIVNSNIISVWIIINKMNIIKTVAIIIIIIIVIIS